MLARNTKPTLGLNAEDSVIVQLLEYDWELHIYFMKSLMTIRGPLKEALNQIASNSI